jgi:hypothetical protein
MPISATIRQRSTRTIDQGAHSPGDPKLILSSSLNTLELSRLVNLWRGRQRGIDPCANLRDVIAQIHSIEQITLKNSASLLKQCR